jgi:hypothetical protein
LYGKSTVIVRYFFGHIPDMYRTYTEEKWEVVPSYSEARAEEF